MHERSLWSKYGFLWVTLALFVGSLAGHWVLAWFAFVDEQVARSLPIEFGDYLIEVGRDTLENWQSEFLQLAWQVAGLAILFYVGSPQSKEGSDRTEEKIDLILKSVAKDADARIAELDHKYGRG